MRDRGRAGGGDGRRRYLDIYYFLFYYFINILSSALPSIIRLSTVA